jgi:hypothetical protein
VIEIGWFTSKVELDQGDGDGHKMVIKCSTFGKEEREKTLWTQGKGIS